MVQMTFILSGRCVLHVVFLLAILFCSTVHAYKYFQEPRGRDLQHYDARYFRGRVSPERRAQTMSGLIVAFLEIMETEGIVAWLAHGTLMGWYWNGHALPWDWDVDMQIDVTSLQTLAEEYNSTVWTAVPANAGPDTQPRDYLLDVNPYWMERVHGDGLNFIDARFIDTTNGLYVDITALTELDPTNLPNVVSCKNYHNYNLNDLYPLRETLFEGTLAKVPYNYKTILAEEYGQRSLILADFNGYVWSRDKSQWVPKREAKSPYRINSLPSTPSTRVIPEDELPYYEDPASPVIPEEPEVLSHLPPPHHSQSSSSNIEIEQLPSDKIDTPTSGKGNILTTLKDYLTLFWRN